MDPFDDASLGSKDKSVNAQHIVVPFGKYKGQPAEVLKGDPSYTEWLCQQSGFPQRYPDIHTLIINNFGDPSETPEHNALQLRFLDESLCRQACRAWLAFLNCGEMTVLYNVKDITFEQRGADVHIMYETWAYGWRYIHPSHCFVVKEDGSVDRWARQQGSKSFAWTRQVQGWTCGGEPCWRDKVTHFMSPEEWHKLSVYVPGVWELDYRHNAWMRLPHTQAFGGDKDVKVREWHVYPGHISGIPVALELKPSLGDDYPVCLRKMLAPHGAQILCYERWASQMPAKQVCQLFAKSKRLLCSLDDLAQFASEPQIEAPPLLPDV